MKTLLNLGLVSLLVMASSCLPPTGAEKTELEVVERSRGPANSGGATREDSIAAFQSTVYPLLRSKTCVACHGEAGPYLKFVQDDPIKSWEIMVETGRKVNLAAPETSRIYQRIKNENHNCWAPNCDTASAELLAEINAWVEQAGAGSNSGINSDPLTFADQTTFSAQTEFGTLMLEAEQGDYPQANLGRFVTDLDGKASNSSYALTPLPPANPTTAAARTATINRTNNCEVIAPARLDNSVDGPYQISEEATHINSGTQTPDGLTIKDGHRPFSVEIRALLIRPDKRLEYAKRLTGWSGGSASGNSDFLNIADVALADGNFDTDNIELRSSQRDPNPIPISGQQLEGDDLDYLGFKILPYFVKRNQVFSGNNYINTPDAVFQNLQGQDVLLKNLFAPPQVQLTTHEILDNIEIGKFSESASTDYRVNVLYRRIFNELTAFSGSADPYAQIPGIDFFDLNPQLSLRVEACPGNSSANCGPDTQDVEITPGSDTASNGALTFANAKDILKVNAAGDGFVAGNATELANGQAFRRMDIYAHIYEPAAARTPGDSWTNTFYNSAGSVTGTVDFPIDDTDSNLNLRALYTAGNNALTPEDNLANFQSSLFPVLRTSACINCHASDPARQQFANSNPIVAFNALDSNSFIDFGQPGNSFRKVTINPTGLYMVHNCNGTNNNNNGTACAPIETAFINAINQWNAANDASRAANSAQIYQELTEKERTPGQLDFEFRVQDTGYYNVWTKVKSGNGTATNISVRVMDGATPLTTFTGIQNPSASGTSCVDYNLGDNDLWTWWTPGRANELPDLDALGEKKLDNQGNPRTISDNRRYWYLEGGKTYKVQIFERAINTKIDLVALDRVVDHDDILDFQPDLRKRDENNISDYQRKLLSYDISAQVGLPPGSSFFQVEVKEAFGGQNYIFRNPRFVSPGNNLRVSNIKVYINGTTKFTDSAWTQINVSTGDDKILTYASLVTLQENGIATDQFHFNFDILQRTNDVLTEVDPRGASPVIVDGRRCREIDLFMNSVKPILRNARLIRKTDDGLQEFVDDFPGTRRNGVGNPQMYNCMSCHDDTHLYFKMTTFDYPEILCSQALSRVDFENFANSLLVRGINGSGVHPKLYFVDELEYTGTGVNKRAVTWDPNNGTRIMDGQYRNRALQDANNNEEYFSKYFGGGYFDLYDAGSLSISTNWGSNNTAARDKARAWMGQIKRINYQTIPNDLSVYAYYEPFVHDELEGEIRSEADNITTGNFVENSRNRYTEWSPANAGSNPGNRPYSLNVCKSGGNLTNCTVGAQQGTIYNVPYDQSGMIEQYENMKSNYRQVILDWIAAEHAARQ